MGRRAEGAASSPPGPGARQAPSLPLGAPAVGLDWFALGPPGAEPPVGSHDALAHGGPQGSDGLGITFKERKVFQGFCFFICISSRIQKAQSHSLKLQERFPACPSLLAATEMPDGAAGWGLRTPPPRPTGAPPPRSQRLTPECAPTVCNAPAVQWGTLTRGQRRRKGPGAAPALARAEMETLVLI